MKRMKRMNKWIILAVLLASFIIIGCNSGTDGSGEGSLSLSLTDSAISGVEEVWVTIAEIQVHSSEDGWFSLESDVDFPITVDLLTLQNGIVESLGLSDIPEGHYTQIRLYLGAEIDPAMVNPPPYPNCIFDGTDYQELTIPSGFQSGIKLVHPFDIESGATCELTLDFDASRSIHRTGSGVYKMRPTIKVVATASSGSVSGQAEPEPGAIVMAQQTAADTCGGIDLVQTTTANADGSYQLAYLEPGSYTVVVIRDGFSIAVEADVQVEAGVENTGHDFTLTALENGDAFHSISGTVSNVPTDETANPRVIAITEIDSNSVAADQSNISTEDGSYILNVPPGDYILYFCTQGENPVEEPVVVDQDDVTLDTGF
ncbi:MAG: DUF4382 domain-containing protein [Deltaproteobacteria bacterium]|nr:DUF4382 domain-containing protein [Deltaproteobacteria bacterium]